MRSLFHLFILISLFLFSCKSSEEILIQEPISAENALMKYLYNGDKTFAWKVKESYNIGDVTAHVLFLTSQKWREHTWVHQLTILVPSAIEHDGALLFITGKAVKNGEPQWRKQGDDESKTFAALAQKNKAITAILWQTPNQPLYDNLTEDALISFTLHNFKQDGDWTWPLLFPMTKSAHKAMDAIQEFGAKNLNTKINSFLVSGASKRGWTTWLTAATDKRVKAIAPMVIDALNMPVGLQYQLDVWKDYSIQIEDYTKLGIAQEVHTGRGPEITRMIDPYAYRANLKMPKLLLIGTNDEYWPVDAVKLYWKDIPGENYIHYTPNAGHNLGGGKEAIKTLSAFWGRTLKKDKYPSNKWILNTKTTAIELSVKASSKQLVGAHLWTADSDDRDFRDAIFVKKDLMSKNTSTVTTNIAYPNSGFRAFYLDLEYTDPNGGTYTKSTRMFVADENEVFEKY